MSRSSVDLPEPLCPMSPNDSPGATSSEMLRSAQNSSYWMRRKRVSACLRLLGRSVYRRNRFEMSSTRTAGPGPRVLELQLIGSQLLGDVAAADGEDPPADDER